MEPVGFQGGRQADADADAAGSLGCSSRWRGRFGEHRSEAESGSTCLFLDAETTQFSKRGRVPAVSGRRQGPGDAEVDELQTLPLKFRAQ